MKHFILAGILVSLLTVSCVYLEEVDEFAIISFFMGEVKKNDIQVNIGDILKENDVIVTGKNSFCDLKIGSSMIRVKENSTLHLSRILRKESAENTLLRLDVGKLLCKPKKLAKNESFIVTTPTVVAGVRGTLFAVEADVKKTTRIKVYRGSVKVSLRIEPMETKLGIERIYEDGSTLEQNERAIITEDEVKAAESKIEKEIALLSNKKILDEDILLQKIRSYIVLEKRNIQKFRPEDFVKEQEDLIAVESRSPEIMKAIRKVIRRERDEPMPDGSLLITRYDFYLIKNGKVEGEWKIIGEPVQWRDRIYIASKDYVFCASVDGPLRWRRKIKNNGRVELKENNLIVNTPEGAKKLDLISGAIIE
ncbi:MAG: FecR domain-containing protein [Spirochaetes bacterium]|nr:FecR domain-containing protein [Spirochaetota bacterium]